VALCKPSNPFFERLLVQIPEKERKHAIKGKLKRHKVASVFGSQAANSLDFECLPAHAYQDKP